MLPTTPFCEWPFFVLGLPHVTQTELRLALIRTSITTCYLIELRVALDLVPGLPMLFHSLSLAGSSTSAAPVCPPSPWERASPAAP